MLNDYQKIAAFGHEGNTLVSASPGSGKTRTLIARAEHKLDGIPANKTLALITYTNAAADEIAERIVSEQSIFIGTIHRFCLEFILRPYSWLYKWYKPRIISFDELNEFFEDNPDIDLGNNFLDEINKIKKTLTGELDYNVSWRHSNSIDEVSARYFDFLDSKKSIDFNEILYRSYKILSENEFVAKSLANKFHEILIDEFQDTNIFQYEIFKRIKDAGTLSFFMVGDERQRIYRFAGAIEDAFENAQIEFDSQHHYLPAVYRSSNIIVNGFCRLFDNHQVLENNSVHKEFSFPISLQPTNRDNIERKLKGIVDYLVNEEGLPLSEIAILSSRWTDSINSSRILRKEYNVVGLGALPHAMRNLNNSTFGLFRSLAQFHYKPSVGRLRGIKRAIELHTLEYNLDFDEQRINYIQNQLLFGLQRLDFEMSINDGIVNIKALFDKIFNTTHSTFNDIIDRITEEEAPYWSLGKYLMTLSGVNGITINTIHQAKGLEYEAVILDQMNLGRIPYQMWDRSNREFMPAAPDDVEDGRNLFYVAMSRAKKYLIITHNWNPSRFINIITPS